MNFANYPFSDLFVTRYKGGELWIPTNQPNECIWWMGAILRDGYGQMRHNGRKMTAHSAVMLLLGQPLATSKFHYDHLCRERICVNPWHLEYVSAAENTKRAQAARRQRMMAA